MNCPQCGAEMRYIKAGISKTSGKPYPAFNVCDTCGYKPPRPRTATAAPRPNFNQVMEKKDQMIQRAQMSKEYGIKVSGSKSIAGNIVAAMIHAGEIKGSDWFVKFDEIAKRVYAYTPTAAYTPDSVDENGSHVDDVNIPFEE